MGIIANNTKASKATFKVGADTYTEHVGSWRIKATTPVDAFIDVSGKVKNFVGEPSCTIDIGLLQDWSDTGLASFLFDNRGTTATIIVEDANATWTVTATLLMPSEIGGDTGKAPQSTLSLPVDGVPAKTLAV